MIGWVRKQTFERVLYIRTIVIHKQICMCIFSLTDSYFRLSVEMAESNAKNHPLFARDKVEHVGGRNQPMM